MNKDGKITLDNINEAIKSFENIYKKSELATKGFEYKNNLCNKSLYYIEKDKQAKKVEKIKRTIQDNIEEDENY